MASTVTAEVTGLGIAQDKDGRGMDALTHRRIIEGDWESEGIVTGLAATANTGKGMSWHIAEGVAVTKRSDADGMAVVYWPGGDVTGETGGDEARTDFLWIRQLDAAQGDSSNRVEAGISTGPTGTGDVGDVSRYMPTGAVCLGIVYVGAGVTQSEDDYFSDGQDYAARRGVSQGLARGGHEWLNTTNRRKVRKGESWTFSTANVSVATQTSCVMVMMAVSVWADDCKTKDWMGSGYVELLLDGVVQQCFKFSCTPYVTETKTFFWTLDLAKGDHTVAARLWGSSSDLVSSVVTQYEAGSIPGQYMRVIDLGGVG